MQGLRFFAVARALFTPRLYISVLQIVTADGCENMTDVPRKTYEVERVMAGESWALPVSRG